MTGEVSELATEIFVRNLPDGTSEEFLHEFLADSVKILKIQFLPDPNPNTTSCQASILVDLPLYDAEQLASRFNGRIVGGHTLQVMASLYTAS